MRRWHHTLDREITDVDPVERAVLRLGAYELVHRIEVPLRVVINEGVELAKPLALKTGTNTSMVFWTSSHARFGRRRSWTLAPVLPSADVVAAWNAPRFTPTHFPR